MGRRLLIVEDDGEIADSLAELFSSRGYHVEIASNGRQAIDQVRASGQRPDAILLDLQMPVLDGGGFLDARAGEPLLASVPVIVLAGLAKRGPELRDVYARIEKPVPVRLLLETVERAIG